MTKILIVEDEQTLRETLPEFMVPALFVSLAALPLTPNGKIDRKRLPAPEQHKPRMQAPFVAPQNPLEGMIAGVWRDVLKLETVGAEDNFFDLGGQSLLVVQVHRKLREQIPQPLSLTDLYRVPTIRSLAEFLGELVRESGPDRKLPIHVTGHGIGGTLASVVALWLLVFEFPQPPEDDGHFFLMRYGQIVGRGRGLLFRHVAKRIITMGDPTGIGPEIIVKALSMKEPFQACRPIAFGDCGVLSRAIQMQNLPSTLEVIEKIPEDGYLPQKIFLFSLSQLDITSLRFGQPDRVCGEAMVKYIEEAVRWVKGGALDAITTCPINKQAINEAGYPFPGHTELLAHLVGATSVAMMFLGSRWKIVLVTTHLPLKEVSRWITANRIFSTLRLTNEGMKKYFKIPHPKMAVLGLNPHCGEGGLLGEEENKEILPAITEAKSLGMDVQGPFPADSFFDLSGRYTFDVIVSMYHDQSLIPIKMVEFKEAVNITLGLPFVRTSVDHGTAYDIAGTGLADPTNLVKAILTAANLLK